MATTKHICHRSIPIPFLVVQRLSCLKRLRIPSLLLGCRTPTTPQSRIPTGAGSCNTSLHPLILDRTILLLPYSASISCRPSCNLSNFNMPEHKPQTAQRFTARLFFPTVLTFVATMSAATPKPHANHRQEGLTCGGGTKDGKAVAVNFENASSNISPILNLEIVAQDIRAMNSRLSLLKNG